MRNLSFAVKDQECNVASRLYNRITPFCYLACRVWLFSLVTIILFNPDLSEIFEAYDLSQVN